MELLLSVSGGTVHSSRGIAAWTGIVAWAGVGGVIRHSRSTAPSRGRTHRPRVRSEVLRSGRRATGATRRSFGKQIAKRLVWTLSRLVPKDPGLIVVHGLTDSEDGALAILERLSERGHSPVRLTAVPSSPYHLRSIRKFRKLSIRGIWCFTRSGFIFTSHGLFGGRATPLGQASVLFWHGEVVKPIGLLHKEQPVAADIAPVCSDIGRKYRCAELALDPLQVPVIGAPRNDRLLSANRHDVRRRLGWKQNDSIWLWLPTYRSANSAGQGGSKADSINRLPFDDESIEQLDKQLAAHNITLVLKPHPLAPVDLPGQGKGLRVMHQSDVEISGVSLYEVLAAVDGLVTDASSVWIDYLLVGRPIIFAFPDIEQYRSRRGLNLEPYERWAPGPFAHDVQSLVHHLTTFTNDRDEYAQQREEMLHNFHRYTDASSTDRLLDLLGL
jgi:CDP-glycerol glycerophosphotransferase